jgi:hypothetical protein
MDTVFLNDLVLKSRCVTFWTREGTRTDSCEINCTSLHQAKVQELYRLDRLLQEESGTLQSLQQDKVSSSSRLPLSFILWGGYLNFNV